MEKTKDFFISYNTADERWATWIAGILEAEGYSTIIQAWDFRPGNNFVTEMKRAFDISKKMIAVLSNNYINSNFCQAEWSTAFRLDPTGSERKLIPVRIEAVPLPALMATNVYIDIVGKDEETAASAIIQGISEKPIDRTKPEFPGTKKTEAVPPKDKKLFFSFTIEKDGTANLSDISAKNNLRKWFTDNRRSNFEIIIEDKRVNSVELTLAPITSKIENGYDLTPEEELIYQFYTKQINRLETDVALKKLACTYFLGDNIIRGALHIDGVTELQNYLITLLSHDHYTDKQRKLNDRKHTLVSFDIVLSPKEKYNFTVPLATDTLIENFGENLFMLSFEYADRLKLELLKDASIYYYFFLAELFYYDSNDKLVTAGDNVNLLNYKIGLF